MITSLLIRPVRHHAVRIPPTEVIALRNRVQQVALQTRYHGSSHGDTRVLFVGTFPPRECGIATFTDDVRDAYDACQGFPSDVIAVSDEGMEYQYASCVIGEINRNVRSTYVEAARIANAHDCDIVNVQHEYGLYGGHYGAMLVEFVAGLRKPVVITLHTVLPNPGDQLLNITRELCHRSETVIVLAEIGRQILQDVYGVDICKVKVVLHGAPDVPAHTSASGKRALGLETNTVLTTFGLLSRGKGIEYVLNALPTIFDRHPDAVYMLLGETHPEVRRVEGESYRESLREQAQSLGIGDRVRFENRYLADDEVVSYLMATDVYVSPSLDRSQIVSGTLSYAVACGRAAVATEYLYARELLAEGRGITVPLRDSHSLAGAINHVLDDPKLRHSIEANAYRFGRRMTWPRIAADYEEAFVASRLQSPHIASVAGSGFSYTLTL